jgi:hypothetical protein
VSVMPVTFDTGKDSDRLFDAAARALRLTPAACSGLASPALKQLAKLGAIKRHRPSQLFYRDNLDRLSQFPSAEQ